MAESKFIMRVPGPSAKFQQSAFIGKAAGDKKSAPSVFAKGNVASRTTMPQNVFIGKELVVKTGKAKVSKEDAGPAATTAGTNTKRADFVATRFQVLNLPYDGKAFEKMTQKEKTKVMAKSEAFSTLPMKSVSKDTGIGGGSPASPGIPVETGQSKAVPAAADGQSTMKDATTKINTSAIAEPARKRVPTWLIIVGILVVVIIIVCIIILASGKLRGGNKK